MSNILSDKSKELCYIITGKQLNTEQLTNIDGVILQFQNILKFLNLPYPDYIKEEIDLLEGINFLRYVSSCLYQIINFFNFKCIISEDTIYTDIIEVMNFLCHKFDIKVSLDQKLLLTIYTNYSYNRVQFNKNKLEALIQSFMITKTNFNYLYNYSCSGFKFISSDDQFLRYKEFIIIDRTLNLLLKFKIKLIKIREFRLLFKSDDELRDFVDKL